MEAYSLLVNLRKGIQSSSEQPLVGEEHCVTRLITAAVIYCITCTLCKKIYIGETGRRLADRFREHLRDAQQNNTDASKPVARHFNLPNHSHHNMTICGLYLHHGNTESRKNLEQKLIFQLGTLSPRGINERLSFH